MRVPAREILLVVFASCTGSIAEPPGAEPSGGPDELGPDGNKNGVVSTVGLPGKELAATIGVRRLNARQYDNTVRDLLGEQRGLASGRLSDMRTVASPFGSYVLQEQDLTDDKLLGILEGLASDIAGDLMKDTARRDKILGDHGCKTANASCLQEFITRFGRRALRRPMRSEDIQLYLQLPTKNGTATDFYASVQDIVGAFLQDLEFLHRVEIGKAVPAVDGLFELTPWEVASRLSYFLWDSMPADWLIEHVEKENGLTTAADIRAVTTKMLADPRAWDQVATFHAMWLGYDLGLGSWGFALAKDMLSETNALIAKVIFEDKKPWQELLRSPGTIVSYELAKHYGLKIPPGLRPGSKPMWVTYDGTPRRGLLSQAAILRYGDKFGDTSPVIRGKLIRERLFCQPIPPPNPKLKVNVDEPPKAIDKSLCKWNRYQPQLTQGACSPCHSQMNPIGFGLENFDALGRYRTEQYWTKDAAGRATPASTGTPGAEKCPINADGIIEGRTFSGPAQLADVMLGNADQLTDCVLGRYYEFTTGRGELDATDKQALGMLKSRTGGKDFDFSDRIYDMVLSDAFTHRRAAN